MYCSRFKKLKKIKFFILLGANPNGMNDTCNIDELSNNSKPKNLYI